MRLDDWQTNIKPGTGNPSVVFENKGNDNEEGCDKYK